MRANERDKIVFEQPRTAQQRCEVASKCVADLKLSIPTLIDGMDNAVNQAYSGWPDRLYIVGKDGKVAYKGDRGPRGFNPREMERELKKLLAE